MKKTKMLISAIGLDLLESSGKFLCGVCKGVWVNSILCSTCKRCNRITGRITHNAQPPYQRSGIVVIDWTLIASQAILAQSLLTAIHLASE